MDKIDSVRGLTQALCEAEVGVKQVDVAQMSEIMARLADIALDRPSEFATVWGKLLGRAVERRSGRK